MKEPEDDWHNRLLDRTIHEENVFYGRLNFFLVFESVLLAAFVSVSPQHAAWAVLRLAMPLLGVAVSLFWWVAQARQRRHVHILGKRVNDELPEYMAGQYCGQYYWLSVSSLMAHFVPVVFLALWVGVLGWLTLMPASTVVARNRNVNKVLKAAEPPRSAKTGVSGASGGTANLAPITRK